MNVQAWNFVMVVASFAVYIGVALWARVRSTGKFYVAGGSVGPVVNGMATAVHWISAAVHCIAVYHGTLGSSIRPH